MQYLRFDRRGGTVSKRTAYAYLLSDYSKQKLKKFRSAAVEFQDFPGISMVFQDLCLFCRNFQACNSEQ